MSEREEFPKAVKLEAFQRCKKHCERCGSQLMPGGFRYNHRIPCEFGGPGTLENCEVLCLGCDKVQTYGTDIPAIAKSRRLRATEAGIRKSRKIIGWRRFDGTPVHAPRDRNGRDR